MSNSSLVVASIVFFAIPSLSACGEASSGAQGSAAASTTQTAGAKALPSAAPSSAPMGSPATALPDGVIPVAKLAELVKANPKIATGQKVQSEGIYWGMSTETSGDKKTYVLEIVASKDDTTNKALCHSATDPADLPHADNQAHEKAITVVVEGSLSASMSNKPVLGDCTYKKK